MIDITNIEPEKIRPEQKENKDTKPKLEFLSTILDPISEEAQWLASPSDQQLVQTLYIELCDYLYKEELLPLSAFSDILCLVLFDLCIRIGFEHGVDMRHILECYQMISYLAGREVMQAVRAFMARWLKNASGPRKPRYSPVWWDPTGQLREENFVTPAQARLLNITPARNSRLFQYPVIAKHILTIYLTMIDQLIESDAFPKRSVIKKRIQAVKADLYYFRRRNGSFNNFLRYLLKISENIVRRALPSSKITKSLNEEKEIDYVKSKLLKKGAAYFDELLKEQRTCIPQADLDQFIDTLEEEGEPVWPFLLDQLRKADKKQCVRIIEEKKTDAERLYKELLKQGFALKIIGLYKLLQQKSTPALQKKLKNSIHPSWQSEFDSLLNKPWSLDVYNELLQMKKPRRKHISLSESELGQARKRFQDTVETVNAFLPEEEMEIPSDEQTQQETIHPEKKENEHWSLKNLLIRLLQEPMSLEQFEQEAAQQHTFVQSLIDQINEQYFDLVNDALVVIDHDQVGIDPYYIEFVKEALHEDQS